MLQLVAAFFLLKNVYCWEQTEELRLPGELRVVNEGIAHGNYTHKLNYTEFNILVLSIYSHLQ